MAGNSGFATFAMALGLSLSCSADSETQMPPADACNELVASCHPKDDGTPGALNDCHATGHSGVAKECDAQYFTCYEICDAAPFVEAVSDGSVWTDDGADDSAEMPTEDTSGSTGGNSGSTTGTLGDSSTSSAMTMGPSDSGSSDSETGADDSSEASCRVIGAGCHDATTPLGVECHDVGHNGDEAVCAEAWVQCKRECGF